MSRPLCSTKPLYNRMTCFTNPTMYQLHILQCTILEQKCAHVCTFLLQNDALCDICLMHWGICSIKVQWCVSASPGRENPSAFHRVLYVEVIFQWISSAHDTWGWDKWPPFCRRHLQIHFGDWQLLVGINRNLFIRIPLAISQHWFR